MTSEATSRRLSEILLKMEKLVIAFSGGVDSTLLLDIAHELLPGRVLALTIRSPAHSEEDYTLVSKLAERIGAAHRFITGTELSDERVRMNPVDRCFHCKTLLFSTMLAVAEAEGYPWVAEGTNCDDLSDYRPGLRALKSLNIRSPFLEAGMTKADIRHLARERGIPVWDRPSDACLYTRIPYGEEITPIRLNRIARAEKFLRDQGFTRVRVRDHGDTARIELPADETDRLMNRDLRDRVVSTFEEIGYNYVTLDLKGYRRGSMNTGMMDSPG